MAAGNRREHRLSTRADLRELRATLRVAPAKPRVDLRAAPREPDSEPPTPSCAFGAPLSRMVKLPERNETPLGRTAQLSSGNLLEGLALDSYTM